MKAAIGIAIVAAHVAGFAALAARSGGEDLAVELPGPLSIDGRVRAAIADRVEIDEPARGPGLVRRRWRTRYRGGFDREVSAAQLAGPFQDPAAPPCSGRIVVGQRVLDQLAAPMAAMLDGELRGEAVFPVGDYQRITTLALRWASLDATPDDRALVGDAPHGYIRATARVAFDRVDVPIVAAFVPERAGNTLRFRIAARAGLAFGNRAVQWLSDKLGADKLASRLARRQIDDALITTLAPPPPFELPGGQTLRFTYCDGDVEVSDGAWGALPFAVALGRGAEVGSDVLPPRFASAALPPPDRDPSLALDLDINALDALLFELWRTGWLDRQLAEVGLDRRFDNDPFVQQFLTVRISPPHLALPPVIDVDPAGGLRLAADARIAIRDGAQATTGRLWGALRFSFAAPSAGTTLPIAVDLDKLELACERTPTLLVPCYGDLVAALRDRGNEFHGALTEGFARLLADIFVDRRLAAPQMPVDLAIRGVAPHVTGPVLHLALDAQVAPSRR